MHKFAFILLSLMLIVAPVTAQEPTPGASISTPIIRDVAQVTETLGTLTVVILAALAVLILIVVFFVVVVWKLGMPLVTTVQRLIDARDRRDQDEDAREQMQLSIRERQADLLERQAALLERSVAAAERYEALLENIESRDEAQEGRGKAIAAITSNINQHTAAKLKPVEDNVRSAVDELKALKERVDTLVTRSQFDGAVSEIKDQLAKVIAELEGGRLDGKPDAAPEGAIEKRDSIIDEAKNTDAKE